MISDKQIFKGYVKHDVPGHSEMAVVLMTQILNGIMIFHPGKHLCYRRLSLALRFVLKIFVNSFNF